MIGNVALIQDIYGREVTNPVHLTLDTTFTEDWANIKAYVSTPLTMWEQPLAAQFHEIQLDMHLVEAERIGCKSFCSLLCTFSISVGDMSGHVEPV